MASPLIGAGWLNVTVPIENPQTGSTGTGFLVGRFTTGKAGRVFLVTNKHVIHPDPAVRAKTDFVLGRFSSAQDGQVSVERFVPTIPEAVREHPDPDTDVLASDVTYLASDNEIAKKWVTYDLFADAVKRSEMEITVGEEVVTIGYPLGRRQGRSSLPLLRQGIISTPIGEVVYDHIRQDDTDRERALRAFLIDGATVPGSSGSPVVLKPVHARQVGSAIQLGATLPVLLGIVAETTYAPIRHGTSTLPGYAGLGLAFEVETVRETIEAFFLEEKSDLAHEEN